MAKVLTNCCTCKAALEIEIYDPRVVNYQSVTMIVIEHQDELLCTGCGAVLMPALMQLGQLGFGTAVVPVQMQRRRVQIPQKGLV